MKRLTILLVCAFAVILTANLALADKFLLPSGSNGIKAGLFTVVPDTGQALDALKKDFVQDNLKMSEADFSVVDKGPKDKDKFGKEQWVVAPAANFAGNGVFNMEAAFDPAKDNNNITGYLYVYITSPDDRKVTMGFGSDDPIAVWLNGKEIHRNPVLRGAGKDQDTVKDVQIKKGKNALLVKVTEQGGGWGSYAGIIEAAGLKASTDKTKDGDDIVGAPARYIARWLGIMLDNKNKNAAVESTAEDLIALRSGGALTEKKVANDPKLIGDGKKIGDRTWAKGDLPNLGGNNLNDYFVNVLKAGAGDINDTASYTATYVISPNDRDATLLVGSDDGIVVWLNGEEVHRNPALRGLGLDADKKPIKLKKGGNFLLIKVIEQGGGWGMSARFDPDTGLDVDWPLPGGVIGVGVEPKGKLVTSWGSVKGKY